MAKTPRVFIAAFYLSATFLPWTGIQAQQAQTSSLHEILVRLEANLKDYDAHIPNFFCDEHIDSSQSEPGERDIDASYDSVFRVKRAVSADRRISLEEAREIRLVDGKPAKSQKVEGPSSLHGAFEGGLAVVSLEQTRCMEYRLQQKKNRRPSDAYVVEFATSPTAQDSAGCLLQENSRGRATIDPGTMQITHLEINTPRHTIVPGTAFAPAIVGNRELTVDYAAVEFDGQSFWLPATINMRSISGQQTFHPIVWTYKATYANYHKMEVTSRILPDSPANVK